MKSFPLVSVYKVLNKSGYERLVFWCIHCKAIHRHGGSNLEHRVAHCHKKDSPYKETGYLLDIKGRANSEQEVINIAIHGDPTAQIILLTDRCESSFKRYEDEKDRLNKEPNP